MKAETTQNEIINEVRRNREQLLQDVKGNASLLDKKGKLLAKKYGLKISNRKPLVIKSFGEVV